MNEQIPAKKSSTSVFTILGLSLLILGGGIWLMLSPSNGADPSDTVGGQDATVSADHGTPIPSRLATVKGNVVHLTKWGYDVDKAFALSKETGKPVLMMLTADWCGPCQVLKKEVLSLPEVDEQIQARFTPVVWDLTEPSEADLKRAEKWQVGAGIPEMLIFDAQGDMPVNRIMGAVPQSQFEKWLTSGTAG